MRVPNCPRRGKRVGKKNPMRDPGTGKKGRKKSDAALVFDEPLSKNKGKGPKQIRCGTLAGSKHAHKRTGKKSDASALLVPSDWNPKASAAGNAGTVPYDPKSN